MTPHLKDHLEEYLSGDLAGHDLERFEREMGEDPAAADAVSAFAATQSLFEAVRPPEGIEPAPGFAQRVSLRIEQEKRTPFWTAFLQPFVIKRLAFASLMWMLALGSLAVFTDSSTERSVQLADTILQQQPPTEEFYVRMGADLERNRNSMLNAMLIARAE